MECDVCKNSKEVIYKCDACRKLLCKLCARLTSSEIKCLQLKERVMLFYCDQCRKMETYQLLSSTIMDKDNLIASKNKIIELLEKELAELRKVEPNIPGPCTYASVVKNPPAVNKTILPCLIIKPNKHQECSKTKNDIEKNINPSRISVGINSIKSGKNGSILIQCNTGKSTQMMKEEVSKVLGSEYTVDETKLRKPSVRITNLRKDITKEEVYECIVSQNEDSGFSTEDYLDVIIVKNCKKRDTAFAIINCNGSSFNKFMTSGKINIGFLKCPVYENVYLGRCFKCLGFNHKKEECKQSETICSICSENHSYENCNSKVNKCINCVKSNDRYHTKFDVNHGALSFECAIYKKKLEVLKERTNYKI